MQSDFTFYRLAHMMNDKYGEGWETRYAMVARFVAFEIKEVFTEEQMEDLCTKSNPLPWLKLQHLIAFQKFFGFKGFQEFFTAPETMPVQFKNQPTA